MLVIVCISYLCLLIFLCLVKVRSSTRGGSEPPNLLASMDVDPNMLDSFVRCNPIWDGHHLVCRVGSDFETVVQIIKYCLKFADFSDTRWGKVGSVCRLFVRATLVG